ncbi:MAG: phosphate ABC transporter permease PstA [Haloferacaceae archaeon]
MSGEHSREVGQSLVSEAGIIDRLAPVPAALAVLSIAAGWALLFQWVSLDGTVAGLPVATGLGLAHVLSGVVLVAIGVVSYLDYDDTAPDRRVGAFTAFCYGGVAFVAVGLTLTTGAHVGPTLGVLGAVVAAMAVTAATLSVSEDLGTTLPVGAAAVVLGAAVLTGFVGPGWSWSPTGLSATFVGTVAVAVLSLGVGLFALWAAAVAHRGFGARGRQLGAHALMTVNAAALLVVLVLLVVFVTEKGLDRLLQGAQLWPPALPFVTNGYGLMFDVNGVLPAIVGTVWLVVGAVAFAVPLGVGAAVYLTEYAEQGRLTAVVETATNGLWSTPSIVYGLFGYAFLVPRLGNHSTILAGQLVLGFMLLPLVLITSREALLNVPDEYRDASAALGVDKWQTIRSVVLPAAVPGVLTGVILGVGRIAGETAPILLVLTREPFLAEAPHVLSSFHLQATPPFVTNEALLAPATALPYQLFAVITAGVGAPIEFGWATALVLLLVVLSLYAVGIATRIYFRRRLYQ